MNFLFIMISLIFCKHHPHKTSSHRVLHLRHPHAVPYTHLSMMKAPKNSVENPLVKEIEEAEKLDKQTLEELKRPITDEMLHNPNVPIYEPYKLTEAQQIVLLSHE